MPVRRSSRHAVRQLIAACGALAVDGADVCRSCSCGSSSPLSTALCSRLVGGDCWRCQPAARCVMGISSLCCKPCSRCRWRWRLKRLPVRLFVVAVVCFVFSLGGGDCWRCRYAAGINSSLLQAVLELSMARASAEATQVALHRRRWQLNVHDASAAMAGIASPPLVA